jgi:glycosyltransferase A (GT-A) superfamily protein (DUF2064 family)
MTKTALLIFARTASEESKHKTFKASEVFFDYQNKELIKLAQASKLEYFWIDEHQQVGDRFALRYLNAIESIFQKGFSQVISIGNDSPGLNSDHIQQAKEALHHTDMCFGPAQDGGFYLWGIKKELFSKQNFLNQSWSTGQLLSQLLKSLEQQSVSVICLQTLVDVDFREDALRLMQTSRLSYQLKLILFQILEQDLLTYPQLQFDLKSSNANVYYNKGSPLAA